MTATHSHGEQILQPRRAAATAGREASFVASGFCRQTGFGNRHPLSIPRVATVLELCDVLGWLEGRSCVESSAAAREQLLEFHEAAYVDALQRADALGQVTREARERYGFGTLENPLFPGVFARAATAVLHFGCSRVLMHSTKFTRCASRPPSSRRCWTGNGAVR